MKKRLIKGEYGFYKKKTAIEIAKVVGSFLLVAAVYLTGFLTTGSKKNLLTVVAMLGVLPAGRLAASAFARFAYKTITDDLYKQIRQYQNRAIILYDMVLTSREKSTQIDCIGVSGNTIYGYTSREKADTEYVQKHIRTIMKGHKYTGLTIKITKNEKAMLAWLDSLPEEREETEKERYMAQLLRQIAL